MFQTEQLLQNRYQLKQELGQIAGRQTWLAEDLRTQETVVVKLLTFNDQVHWENLRLFEREAQVLKQLNHPRIPRYRDYFCVDDLMLWFGLVQDYIPGSSLKEILAQGKAFTEQETRTIAENVLEILIYLHGLSPPVLHRDIKPSNLILGEDGYIYLVDFGAVQDRAAKEGATFTVVGTYGYVPLEQFGGRATSASDLYALGATLIHLLTGIAPAELPQQDSRIQFANLVNLNPGFVRWLRRLTEPNLERRFSNAREAIEALKENHAVSSLIVNSKPFHSRIQLKKSPTRLKIKIPAHRFNGKGVLRLSVSGLAFVLFALYGLSTNPAPLMFRGLWFFVVVLLYLVLLLLPFFRKTDVYFNSQNFEIEWKLFGLRGRLWRGQIAEIDKVFRSKIGGYGKGFPGVTIAVGVQEFVLTPLTEAECDWLVQEIKNWLGLK